ncbi:MAG TPA: sulfatase-like hydrolase/transferase [Acidobacteriaceae bacterium]|nr:sulfatase-like hydrolase/transferase [Acidobacteriaceae bacterium]
MATLSETYAADRLTGAAGAPSRLLWTARITAAAVLIPQLPALLWWMGTHSSLYQRGWINIEYLVLLCVALLWPSWLTLGLLTAEMCLALLEPVAHLYYFHPGDVLFSLRYLRFLPAVRLTEYALLLFLYAACCGVALRWAVGRSRHPAAPATVAGILVCAIVAAGAGLTMKSHSLKLKLSTADVRGGKLVRAPMTSLLVAMGSYSHDTRSGPGDVELDSALARAMTQVPVGAQPDIVLVLTESWGLASDSRINVAETLPYTNPELTSRYHVITGTVPFDGATTSGETRELCGNAEGVASLSSPAGYFASCWPARLNRDGYRTVAVHGFTPTMFRREAWYSRFGFRQSVFQPQLLRDGGAMCGGAFPGVCDADVASWIGDRLLQSTAGPPTFVHWVTLNSHLPVPPPADTAARGRCASVGIAGQEGLCSWFNLVLRVHQSIAQLAANRSRPAIFIIVGDHAPPFLRAETRARFSQSRVPYVILAPHVFDAAPAPRMMRAANDAAPSARNHRHNRVTR